MDRSFAGLPNPVPLFAESPSRSSSVLGTTGSDFDGGELGFSKSWSRMIMTRSGNPARSRFARSIPSTISAPEAPPITCALLNP